MTYSLLARYKGNSDGQLFNSLTTTDSDLLISGTVPNLSIPTPPSGLTAWLASSNGMEDFSTLSYSISIKPDAKSGFISCYFQYSDDLIGEYDFFDWESTQNGYFYLYTIPAFGDFDSQVIVLEFNEVSYGIDASIYMDNAVHKIAVSWDGLETKVYIDDILITTIDSSPPFYGDADINSQNNIGFDDVSDGFAYMGDVTISSAEYVPNHPLAEQDPSFFIARWKGNSGFQLVNEITTHRDGSKDLTISSGNLLNAITQPFNYQDYNFPPTGSKWLGYWNSENNIFEGDWESRVLFFPPTVLPPKEQGHISLYVQFSQGFGNDGSDVDILDIDTADDLGQNERFMYLYVWDFDGFVPVMELDYSDSDGNGVYAYLSYPETIFDGNTHKIALSWDGEQLKYYLDDVECDIWDNDQLDGGVKFKAPSPEAVKFTDNIYQNGFGYYNNDIQSGFVMIDDVTFSTAEYVAGQTQDATKFTARYYYDSAK